MSDPVAVFRLLTEAVESIVDSEPDPTAQTPCTAWSYAQLLGHLVSGDELFVAILSGHSDASPNRSQAGPRTAADPEQATPTPEDYRRWARSLGDLLGRPEIQAGTFDVPVGRLPGHQIVLLRSVEHLLHGWDLARSAGMPTAELEPPAAALMEPARHLLAAVGERTLAQRRPFGDPVEADSEESALNRFVAMFGRDPGWEPDPVAGYAKIREHFADRGDVEQPDGSRRGFGRDGLRINGQVFATPHQGRLMIKLPESEVDALIGAGLGKPLAKPGQRPMREWVLVPFDASAVARAERAYAFVSGRQL